VPGPVRQLDPFAVIAFTLAVSTMCCPTEADLITDPLTNRQFGLAGLVVALCTTAVTVPVVFGWRRRRSRPEYWQGRGYLIAATVILTINTLWCGVAFVVMWLH
jgi:hypothetical protein